MAARLTRILKLGAALAGAAGLTLTVLVLLHRIAPLLPEEGRSVCYSAAFDGAIPLTLGWPHEKRTDQVHVTGMTLALSRAAGQSPHRNSGSFYQYDWRYDFTLTADTAENGRMQTGGQCDWTDDVVASADPYLYCFIDCDGGGIGLSRRAGRRALDVTWDVDGWLRMTGCGEGGTILRAGDSSRSFALSQVSSGECAKNVQP